MFQKVPEKFQGLICIPTQVMQVAQLADDNRQYLQKLGSKL
jgi:hypothetical protein